VKKGARKAVNANARLARNEVTKAVAKTSKTANTNAHQAKNKVKKAVVKTRVEAKKIIRKGKKQKTK